MAETQQEGNYRSMQEPEEIILLPQLPEAVLVSILQQLPLRERLASCALVCRHWAAAAVLTTADLEAELSSCIRWEHVQDWLHQHAGQVSSVKFSHHGHRSQLLPLPAGRLSKLQRLYVHSMTVRLLEIPQGASTGVTDADCSTFSNSCTVTSCPAGAVAVVSDAAPAGASTDGNLDSSAAAYPVAAGAALASVPSCSSSAMSSATASSTAIFPQLRHLDMFSCNIALEHLQQLSRVTGLTSLNLYNSTVTQDTSSLAPAAEEQLTAAMSDVLQGLIGLQELNMGLMGVLSSLALRSMRNMQGLQRLQLDIPTDNELTDSFLESLPASLTALELKDVCVTPSSAVAEQLSRLTNLQALKLEELDLNPLLLEKWTALTSISLTAVYAVLPVVEVSTGASAGHSLSYCSRYPPDNTDRGVNALFSALRQLPQLQQLELSRMQLDETTEPERLSALTASPALTCLHLLARFSMPMPQGALQYVLPKGGQLSQLQVLRLQGGDGVSEQQCLDAADVARIADSCPALTDLTLKGVVSVGASLAPLLKLQGLLKRLSVAGAAFGDAAAMLAAQLSGLQSLEWADSATLSDAGIARLAALRGLTRLYVRSCKGLSSSILPPDTWYAASKLLLEAKPEAPVRRQLQQLCEAASAKS